MRIRPLLMLVCLLCALPALGLEPYLVKDINPVSEAADSDPVFFDSPGPVALFAADDGLTGRELWRSDGTAAGTWQVADTCQPDCSGRPVFFARTDRATFFLAADGAGLNRLWATDGTPAGTFPLTGPSITIPVEVPRLAGRNVLYFGAEDDEHGLELWRSDGTPVGTHLVTDLRRGPEGSGLLSIVAFKGRVYFSAADDRAGGALWKTDGTAAGTVLVKDPDPTTWANERPQWLRAVGGRLVFLGPVPGQGWELWSSDGTGKGTQLLGDFARGQASVTVRDASVVGGRLYLVIDREDRKGQELWVTDGTAKGTRVLTNLPRPDAFFAADGRYHLSLPHASAGNRVVFLANDGPHGVEAWVTDGTEEGTYPLAEEGPRACCVVPRPSALGGTFFFPGRDADHGTELWASDGTLAGTRLVRDIAPGSSSSELLEPTPFQGKLYFTAWNDDLGRELWRSDGTAAGTVLVKDIDPLSPSEPMLLTVHADRLWFFADDGEHGRELWSSDGTAAGTKLAVDLEPGPGSFIPNALVSFGNRLLVSGPGQGIWVTDGTPAGTRKIADWPVAPSFDAFPHWAVFQGRFYYVAWEDSRLVLYVSDGTEAGTGPLLDRDGRKIVAPQRFAVLGDRLLFTAGVSEISMWESDGTPEGTFRLRPETFTGPGAAELVRAGSRVFFPAYSREDGVELWAVEEAAP